MKTHGMTFRDDMALAIRQGRKTQTRRPIDPQPKGFPGWWPKDDVLPNGKWIGKTWHWGSEDHFRRGVVAHCPWQVGDRIFVQEDWWWYRSEELEMAGFPEGTITHLDDEHGERGYFQENLNFDPSKYSNWVRRVAKEMPSWAARTWLEITEIRAQRIQDISDRDAFEEGIQAAVNAGQVDDGTARGAMKVLWQSLYPGSWERNDWVFAYTFKVLEGRAG